jgi:hypothetical protein
MHTTDLIFSIENKKTIIERFVLVSDCAALLRLAILRISQKLSEDAPEIADKLRLAGLRFNTSLISPSTKLLTICGLDNLEQVCITWGEDVALDCRLLSQTVSFLDNNKSLLQNQFLSLLKREIEITSVQHIKIWCHSKDCNSYIDFLAGYDISLSDENFICSLADYRRTDFFSVLIVLGPLRHFGWSSLPRVVVSAPRYRKIMQLVWSGLSDSPEFGCDPFITEQNYLITLFDRTDHVVKDTSLFNMPDRLAQFVDGHTLDDLEIYNRRSKSGQDIADCYLINLGSEQGILLSQGSEHIIFEDDEGLIPFKLIKSKEMESQQFLILHDISADLGAGDKIDLKLAILWKKALNEMYTFQWETLISRMRQYGITLKNLDHAASHWRTIDEKKIHAPQNHEHFRILIDKVLPPGCLNGSTWNQAWREIEAIRTRARQDGRIMAEIINDELVKQLNKDAFEQEFKACLTDTFVYEAGKKEGALIGPINFYRIFDVIGGYRASYEKIGIIDNIDNFELYRTES